MENENVLNLLKTFMEENNLKVGKVEADLGVSKNNLSGIIKGKKPLSKNLGERIIAYIKLVKLKEGIGFASGVRIDLGDLADKVTTADKVPVPENKVYSVERITEEANKTGNEWARPDENTPVFQKPSPWIKEIEEYCSNSGCFPKDLIDAHRNLNKPSLGKKQGIAGKLPVPVKPSMSNWRESYTKAKTGQK